MAHSFITLQNLVKKYRAQRHDVCALNGVSLEIRHGEVVSLLGANGAGKTTLSAILATLHPPTSGHVLWQGASIYEQLASYREIVGYCPQTPNLDEDLSVYENLLFAARCYLLPASNQVVRVEELLRDFGLENHRDRVVRTLSGGTQRRVLIARALVHRPALVILDEPTVGLDPHIRRILWHHIRRLRDAGIAILLTTHYIDEAQELSDRVCVMHQGSIVTISTPRELMEKLGRDTLEAAYLDLLHAGD